MNRITIWIFTLLSSVSATTFSIEDIQEQERVKTKSLSDPTLYVRSEKGTWRNLDGQKVEAIEFDSMREATDFTKRYENIDNFEVYGMNNYIVPVHTQTSSPQIDPYNTTKM